MTTTFEAEARKRLYADAPFEVAFNPLEEFSAPVVDLTYDAANVSQITNFQTKEVRSRLAGAKIVICDNSRLAQLVSGLPGTTVTYLPFGELETSRDIETADKLSFGILAHNSNYYAAASFGRKVINKLPLNGQPLYVLGDVDRLKLEISEEIIQLDDPAVFGACIDILVIPGHHDALLSPTLPHALALAGIIPIFSVKSLGYLSNSGGAAFISGTDWNKIIKGFLRNRDAFIAARTRNQNHFAKTNTNSRNVIPKVAAKILAEV